MGRGIVCAALLALRCCAVAEGAVECDGSRHVCNASGGALSASGERRLEELLRAAAQHADESGCGTGGQVAAVVLSEPVGGETPKALAKRLHDTLGGGVGRASCGGGDGVVLLVALEDRQVELSTGWEVRQGRISDSDAAAIVSRMKPRLRDGDVDAAVLEAAREIVGALAGEPVAPEDGNSWWSLALAALIFAAFVVFAVWHDRRERSPFRRHLSKLDDDVAKARAAKFQPTSCPVCLEDLPEEGSPQRALLRCGHTFCAPCVDKWLERSRACPVCRADAVRDGSVGPPARPQDWTDFESEYAFRVRRLRDRHPRYMPGTTADSLILNPPRRAGELVRVHSRLVPESSSGSRSDGGSRFGGGSSAGGGGASGSW